MGTLYICKWQIDEGNDDSCWISDCGLTFQFTDDGPKENNVSFCPKCGRIIEVHYEESENDEQPDS